MKPARTLVRALGVLALAVMVLVPPWELTYTTPPEHITQSSSIGYHALWHRATVELGEDDPRTNVAQRVNLLRLGLQLALVLGLTNLGLFLVRK